MDKLQMKSKNIVEMNIGKIAELFPLCVTEVIRDGKTVKAIDKEMLLQELSDVIVDENEERYQFTWPDKRKSILLANSPVNKTLRPCKEESVAFDTTQNLYIEGDNLDVLKLLQETYMGKVKMIYIDPPYNTGNDSFVYNDSYSMDEEDFLKAGGYFDEQGNRMVDVKENNEANGKFHTEWLNMIYPRLKLAKELLSDDGVIAISISEEEIDNLKKICNEIFGANNFRNMISTRRYDKNINLQFAEGGLSTMNVGLEFILVYTKNTDTKLMPVFKKTSDERTQNGYWKGFWNDADRPTMRYEILGVCPEKGQWKWSKDLTIAAIQNFVEFERNYSKNMTLEEYWESTGKNKKFIRRNLNGKGKNMGVEHWIPPSDGILRNSNWSDLLASKPAGFEIPFDSPKNPEVIIELMKLADVEKNDVVLDFFSGSATTAHAVMQLNAEDDGNRKFIMVQLPELTDEKSEAFKPHYKNICEIGKERIRRAGTKIVDENRMTAPNLDIGFRVLKLDNSNMKDVYYQSTAYSQDMLDTLEGNIKTDRTPEDLLFQVMLDMGVLLSSKIEEKTIAGKKVLIVNDDDLICCFDSNLNDEVVTTIAKMKPQYSVFRDSSFANDSVATNFEQIFATYSPTTERKVI